jgi:hypothetical protein
MTEVSRFNPRVKMMTANGIGVLAGPALLYVGVFHAPTWREKLIFGGLGGLLLYASVHGLQAGMSDR